MLIFNNRIIRLFFGVGCVGVLVAFCLVLFKTTNPSVLLVLWPTSMAGMGDPETLPDQLLVGAVEFGGNFLLYGMIGAIAGAIATRFDR